MIFHRKTVIRFIKIQCLVPAAAVSGRRQRPPAREPVMRNA
jgi:hypothetical protein